MREKIFLSKLTCFLTLTNGAYIKLMKNSFFKPAEPTRRRGGSYIPPFRRIFNFHKIMGRFLNYELSKEITHL